MHPIPHDKLSGKSFAATDFVPIGNQWSIQDLLKTTPKVILVSPNCLMVLLGPRLVRFLIFGNVRVIVKDHTNDNFMRLLHQDYFGSLFFLVELIFNILNTLHVVQSVLA